MGGEGIGPWFLRHLERTKTLIHVLAPRDGEESVVDQLIADYKIVRQELGKYGKGLAEKNEIVVVNKMELVDEVDRGMVSSKFDEETGRNLIWVSAGMGEVVDLVNQLS